MTPRWLTTIELADDLRYKGRHRLRSVYRFLQKNGVKTCRRGPGGDLLVSRVDVDRVLGALRGKAAA